MRTSWLNELTFFEDTSVLPVPKFIESILYFCSGVWGLFDLSTLEGRFSAYIWWVSSGSSKYPGFSWDLREEDETYFFSSQDQSLPWAFCWYARSRPDLQSLTFDQYLLWRSSLGPVENKQREVYLSSDIELESDLVRVRGVNVIGFGSGVLGIGENVRMAAAVVRQLGFECGIIEPNKILGTPEKLLELEVVNGLSREKYPVSLFCLPAAETTRLALGGAHSLLESPTYKIGEWPWELPSWPATLSGVAKMVDEIWAHSHFIANSFASLKAVAPIEIHYMPLAVEVPDPTENVRYKYKLPERDFLFYVVFDGCSWLSRKNPIAAVKAFRKAFSNNCQGVGLVIKARNVSTRQPMWEEILSIAAKDDRIYIISDTLSRQEVINLMASCNAYISLHRSEGFGRCIAESMLLGLPTVTTNYSGNVDFCTRDTSFLVDGELVSLSKGDYLLTEGQYWCDPDIAQAAECLREVVEDINKVKLLAAGGKKLIESSFSREAVAKLYSLRLNSIFKKIGL